MLLLVDGRDPQPVAVRVRAGRVVEVAPHLEPERGEHVVHLGGRFVRHALHDAHVHVTEWSRARREVDLSASPTAVVAAETVAAAAAVLAPGAVVRGTGFRDALWPSLPSPGLLQAVLPDQVVVLQSMDMHSAWLSPRALALAGVTGSETGLLREHEAWDALSRLPAPTEAEDDEAVAEAARAAHARGLVSLVDFSFTDAHAAWSRRSLAGPLPLRVRTVVMPDARDGLRARGLRTGDGDAFLQVGPVKLFVDGALGARTARCLHPYAGTDDHGQQLLDPEQLRAEVGSAAADGFTVAVHAIGDEATRDALAALCAAQVPGATLEHAQLLRREDLPLFAAAGVTASVQPAHLLDDAPLVDDLWRDTASLPYAGRSLLDAGATLVLGSDAPVSPLDPWRSIAAAVHRTDGTIPPWRPAEALPLEVALHASGARRLRAGDAADLVVLEVDPAELSAAELAAAPVHATMLDGAWVHGPYR